MPAVAAAFQGATAVAQMGLGAAQLIKAKKLERNNVRPTFDIQKEYFDNQGIAQNSAQYGLSERSRAFANSNAERAYSTTSDTLLQTGQGGINGILSAQDSFNRFQQSLAAQDSQLQEQKLQQLMQQNENLANQKMQQWTYNEVQPYERNLATIAQMRNAGTQNLFGGAGNMVKGISSYETGKLTDGLTKAQTNYYNSLSNGGVSDNSILPIGNAKGITNTLYPMLDTTLKGSLNNNPNVSNQDDASLQNQLLWNMIFKNGERKNFN